MGKTGMVIEGGGMRGIYAAGVLDVLSDYELPIDGLIGVSAGAIHGCSYVSKQKGRSIRYYKKYCTDDRFMSVKSLIRTGSIVGTQFCYHDLPEQLDPYDYDVFNQSKIKFYVTCSNLATGKAEYLQITDMKGQIDLMRASASLPFLSEIVSFDGMKLLDGGCTDSVPVRAFQKMGYEKNLVILTRPDSYVKKKEPYLFSGLVYRKYPNFRKALSVRHIRYNKTIADIRRMEKEKSVYVIRPSRDLTIGRLTKDPEEIQSVYDIGKEDALNAIAKVQNWFKQG